MSEFRHERWARAGASEEELEELAVAFGERPADASEAENASIDSSSDHMLSAMLAEQREDGELFGFRPPRAAAEVAPVAPEKPSDGSADAAAPSGAKGDPKGGDGAGD